MKALMIVLIVILIITIICLILAFNTIFRMINNINKYLDTISNKESRDFTTMITISEKHLNVENGLLTMITDLNNNIKCITNDGHKQFETVKSFINGNYQELNNIKELLANNKSDICNKVDKNILGTTIIKEGVELINGNIEKLTKSLKAKNSLCKCKTSKSLSKKNKEEQQANNS